MNTVQKISTPKFLYMWAFKQFSKKLLYIFLWYTYMKKKKKKKKKVFTLTCAGLKSFQWKLFMLWSLNIKRRCCPNQMTNSLRTKTKIKKNSLFWLVAKLEYFPTSRSFGNWWDFTWVTHVMLKSNTRDNKCLNSQGFTMNRNLQKDYCNN